MGLTWVLNYQIGPALIAGDLQIVLSEFEEPALPIHILILKDGMPQQRSVPSSIWLHPDCARTGF